jgi:hypothetical protein
MTHGAAAMTRRSVAATLHVVQPRYNKETTRSFGVFEVVHLKCTCTRSSRD